MARFINKREALRVFVSANSIHDIEGDSHSASIFKWNDKMFLILTEEEMIARERDEYYIYHNEMLDDIKLSMIEANMHIPTAPTTEIEQAAKRLGIKVIDADKFYEIREFVNSSVRDAGEVFDEYKKADIVKNQTKYKTFDVYYIQNITIN